MEASVSSRQYIQSFCRQIIKHRLRPCSQDALASACKQLQQALHKNFKTQGSFYMDVSLLIPGNLESTKIEEWFFGVGKVDKGSFFSRKNSSKTTQPANIQKQLNQLVRMLKNISPEKLYAHTNILRTDFTFTSDQQTLSTLDSQNTFEVPIDYFELEGYTYTITLTYNYEVEDEGFVDITTEPKQKLPEIKPIIKQANQDTNIRKYSEGVHLMKHTNLTQGCTIDPAKLELLRKKIEGINFGKISQKTPRDVLKALHQ